MKRAKTLSSIGDMRENMEYQLRGACRIRMGADGVITCTSYSTDVAWFDATTCKLRFHPDCYNMSSTATRHVGEFKVWLDTRLCHGRQTCTRTNPTRTSRIVGTMPTTTCSKTTTSAHAEVSAPLPCISSPAFATVRPSASAVGRACVNRREETQ